MTDTNASRDRGAIIVLGALSGLGTLIETVGGVIKNWSDAEWSYLVFMVGWLVVAVLPCALVYGASAAVREAGGSVWERRIIRWLGLSVLFLGVVLWALWAIYPAGNDTTAGLRVFYVPIVQLVLLGAGAVGVFLALLVRRLVRGMSCWDRVVLFLLGPVGALTATVALPSTRDPGGAGLGAAMMTVPGTTRPLVVMALLICAGFLLGLIAGRLGILSCALAGWSLLLMPGTFFFLLGASPFAVAGVLTGIVVAVPACMMIGAALARGLLRKPQVEWPRGGET